MVRHGRSEWVIDYLRDAAAREFLFASATTELGIGGDVRSSSCAVERSDGRFRLEKNTPVISYGEYSDAVLVTGRTPDSPPNDQVLVVVPARRRRWSRDRVGTRSVSAVRAVTASSSVPRATSIRFSPTNTATSPRTRCCRPRTSCGRRYGSGSPAPRSTTCGRTFEARRARIREPRPRPRYGLPISSVTTKSSGRWYARGPWKSRWRSTARPSSRMGFALRMNALKTSASTLVVDIVGRAMTDLRHRPDTGTTRSSP